MDVEDIYVAKDAVDARNIELSDNCEVVDYAGMVDLLLGGDEKTLTIMLMSGSAENEDAQFATNLAEAALEKVTKYRCIFSAMPLVDHIEPTKNFERVASLIEKGADISTCHTNEHARGIESKEYVEGVKWGDVGGSFTKYLMTSD
ncbi:DsrE family protein, partial [Aduncisulcus paluster]